MGPNGCQLSNQRKVPSLPDERSHSVPQVQQFPRRNSHWERGCPTHSYLLRGNYEFRKPRWYVKLEAMFHKCLVIAALFQSWTLLRPRKTPFPFRGVDYVPSHLGSLRDPNCTMPEERSEDLVNNLAHFLRQNENATPVNSSPEYWTTLIWWAEVYQHRKAVC